MGQPLSQHHAAEGVIMFKRGISREFESALVSSELWRKIAEDKDLFFAMRNEYVNVYYQGCSIFNISFRKDKLKIETHYKYLINPSMKPTQILWNGETNSIKGRSDDVFIDSLNLGLLKKASSYYAEPEKKGVHLILKSNKNIIDVEIALTRDADVDLDGEDEVGTTKRVADRIDFAALQQFEGTARIVFFEAKRFDNKELRAQGKDTDPPVVNQIKRYEKFIEDDKNQDDMKKSYCKVIKNLSVLARRPFDPLVAAVADGKISLTIDPKVRLVVFGYDADQDSGKVWKDHRDKLERALPKNLLAKGSPKGFTNGVSPPTRKALV